MQLSAARQSRFMLWAAFSEDVANLAKKAAASSSTDGQSALSAIKSFWPSTLNAEGQRQYQIVAQIYSYCVYVQKIDTHVHKIEAHDTP